MEALCLLRLVTEDPVPVPNCAKRQLDSQYPAYRSLLQNDEDKSISAPRN